MLVTFMAQLILLLFKSEEIMSFMIACTDPRDTVLLVLDPMHPVHTVRESEPCNPMVVVLLPLSRDFSHSHQFSKVNLQPLFAVVCLGSPGPTSFTVSMDVQPGSRWTIFGVVAWRSRKWGIWYMTVLQTERQRTAVNYNVIWKR